AEPARKVFSGLDDAGLDEYLRARHVERANERRGVAQALGKVADEERVRALVERDAAALGQHTLHLPGEHVVGSGPVHPEGRQPERRPRAGGDGGRVCCLTLLPQALSGGDAEQPAFTLRLQPAQPKHGGERLIPRDAAQAQRDLPLHLVADGDVQSAHLCEETKNAMDVGILEVERDRTTGGEGRHRQDVEGESGGHHERRGARHRAPSVAPRSSSTTSSVAAGSRMRSFPRAIPTTVPPRGPTGVPMPAMYSTPESSSRSARWTGSYTNATSRTRSSCTCWSGVTPSTCGAGGGANGS